MSTENSVKEYLQRASRECQLRSVYEFSGWRIVVETNSAALKAKLDDYFQFFGVTTEDAIDQLLLAFQADVPDLVDDWQINAPEVGKTKVKEHIGRFAGGQLIKKVRTGVYLAYLGDMRLCAGPLVDKPNQVVNFINNLYLNQMLATQGQLFHAAGVCRGAMGLGLAGQSGKGKSTLALRLLAQGLDFVSNDRLIVKGRQRLEMRGIPKYPRINPGTIVNQDELLPIASAQNLARYRAMPEDALWELEEKYDAVIETCFEGCQFQLVAEMKMFIIINWDRNHASPFALDWVRAADAVDLLPAVMKSPGVMLPDAGARIGRAQWQEYAALLDQTELYVLSGGVDFKGAAKAIKQVLQRD